ncbi:hypothetical protein [Brevibacillus brevis]|uniref:hypothetical protein n=1 Tax=Brevibacillus brevis TaxID=1393 RepID=UPI0037C5C257
MLTLVKERGNVNTPSKEMPNPVAALWEIELLYGKHPSYSELTYGVKFTTRLEGNASKCYLVVDLRERFDEFLRELNVFGSMEKAEFHKAIDYVKHLKINGIFKRVPNLLTVMEGAASADESFELFEMVVESVLSDPDAYPSISSDAFKSGESSGVILDTEQYVSKYGANAVGVTTEALFEILNLDGSTKSTRLLEITRGWLGQGLLLKQSRQARLQEPIKPNASTKEVKRFYILRIDGLGQE